MRVAGLDRYKTLTVCVLFFTIAARDVFAASKIKHIIVVMEENRSFDHMFGYYPGVNGLTGKEGNYVNSSDPKSKLITVDSKQPQIALCDPVHSTAGTSVKIFGATAVAKNDFSKPTM